MGNSQSSTQGNNNNAQQRSAKSKTKTNSPSLTPVSVCSKYADLSITRVRQLKSQVSSPTKSTSGTGLLHDGDEDLGELAAHLQVRLSSLSRSNSIASRRSPGNQKLGNLTTSQTLVTAPNDAVDKDTAIKILKEVRKSASPADLAALRQALKPSSPVPAPAPTPNRGHRNRTSDVHQSTSLTRRRSWMITPGVATRPRSQTEGQRTSRFSWRSSNTGPPGKLGNLPTMSLLEEEHCQTPRAQTPGDLDYSHLGALKLGSLVVTNGTPSPAESIRKLSRRVSYSDLPYEEDYFTASEGIAGRKAREKAAHSRSKSTVLPKTPPFHSAVRGSSQAKMNKAKRGCPDTLKPTEHPESPQEYLKKALRVVNKSEDTLAKSSVAQGGGCLADNSTATHYDEGYSDIYSDALPGFRDEVYRILDGTIFSEPETTLGQTAPMPIPCKSPLREGQRRSNGRPAPSTFDSGYSSGGSFRNKEGYRSCAPQTAEAQPETTRSEDIPDSNDRASLYNFEQMMALSQKPLPPIPTKDLLPNATGILPEMWECTLDQQLAQLQIPEPPTIVEPAPTLAPAARSPSVYQWSWERTTSFSKRLQKRRSSLPDMPPVVQTSPVIDQGTIPSVPDPVRAKFVRRLSDAPEMECLTKTYPSTKHINAKEPTVDPPTTMSRHSSMTSCISLEPEFEPRGRNHSCSQTERPLSLRLGRSLSLFRNRSEKNEQGRGAIEEQAQYRGIDLSAVNTVLESSPYVATPKPALSAVTSPTHPQQLGDALPRSKSMVNMDARTAAELARLRSRGRAARRPEMPQRPTSYYDARPGEGEVASAQGRPHSSYVNTAALGVRGFHDDMPSHSHDIVAEVEEEATPERPGLESRVPSTGRGEVVSQLVETNDGHFQQLSSEQVDVKDGVCLQGQCLESTDEPLGNETRPPTSTTDNVPSPNRSVATTGDRYGGGLPMAYSERGNNNSGSAEARELHRAASRRNMHLGSQLGLDLSDVPVLLQRMF